MTTLGSQADGARDQVRILKELAESLSQAIGGCSQLVHQLRDPRFMQIREALELTQEGVMILTKVQTKIIRPKVTV